jgi:Tfp pilus assembly protein PilX
MNNQTEPRLYSAAAAAAAAAAATARARAQHGVVLIMALILLVVISLLALTSLRNVGSSARVAGNVRTTELATRAADIALRHCEFSVLKLLTVAAGGASSYVTNFDASNIVSYNQRSGGSNGTDRGAHGDETSAPPTWQNMAFWDGSDSASKVYVLPLSLMNQSGMRETYKRAPECMVVQIPVVSEGHSVVSTTSSFVFTARGFGPEVAPVDARRSRPVGSEVWLQSQIEFE